VLLILLVILAVGWAVTGVLSVFYIRGLRESNEWLHEAQSESAMRAIDAERAQATAQTETVFLKQSLAQVLQRPAIAVLTDENVQQLGAIIQSFLKPTSLN
jgi:hypothetical protein